MTAPGTSGLGDLLVSWLPQQRWYGGKGRPVREVVVLQRTPLAEHDGSRVALALLRVVPEDGDPDVYQLLLGERSGELPDRLAHASIGSADGSSWYDAVYDHDAADALLGLLSSSGTTGELVSTNLQPLEHGLHNRVMGAEQSNTSLVYGDSYILKLFRRLQPGANPDVEVTRALAEAGSPHVASPLAWF